MAEGPEAVRDLMTAPRFATLALHSGAPIPRDPLADEAAATVTADGMASLAHSTDPIAAELEDRVAALEGGSAAVALSSGLGCLAALLSGLLRPGEEIVAARSLSSGPLAKIAGGVGGNVWSMLWADVDDPGSFARLISPRTQALLVESVAAEDGRVADLTALAEVARRAEVPLIVDNGAATPALCRPFAFGADAVIYLSMARIGGGQGGMLVDGGSFDWARSGRYPLLGDPAQQFGGVNLSAAAGNFELAAALRLLSRGGVGAPLAPGEARQALLCLETLDLRMRRQSASALQVARFLAGHAAVAAARYSGLEGDRHHNLALRYCPEGAGHVVTFVAKAGAEGAGRVLERLRLFRAEGGDGNVSQALLARETRAAPAGWMRLAVGLEDPADLIEDLDWALET